MVRLVYGKVINNFKSMAICVGKRFKKWSIYTHETKAQPHIPWQRKLATMGVSAAAFEQHHIRQEYGSNGFAATPAVGRQCTVPGVCCSNLSAFSGRYLTTLIARSQTIFHTEYLWLLVIWCSTHAVARVLESCIAGGNTPFFGSYS